MSEIEQGGVEAARKAVERLANTQMNLSLEDWGDISNAILSALPATGAHADDAAVDRFARAMKAKLAKKRAEGYGGWNRKIFRPELDGRGLYYECSNSFLSERLREHVEKGDPIDVANFCMMIHQRDERIVKSALAEIKEALTASEARATAAEAMLEEAVKVAFEHGADTWVMAKHFKHYKRLRRARSARFRWAKAQYGRAKAQYDRDFPDTLAPKEG